MDYELQSLYDMYSEQIRELYKDSDETITYEYKYGYYNSNKTQTIQWKDCDSSDLRNILQSNIISLSTLPLKLNENNQKLYNAYINVARFNYNLACDLFEQNLYINDKDKKILRTSIINNFTGNANFFKRDNLIKQMQLTTDELNKLLLYSLNDYYYYDIVIKFYDKFTNFHKKIILQRLLINQYQALNCLLNVNVPLEFRLLLFQFVFKDKYNSYNDLFNRFYNNDIKDIIRDILFKYVYEHYNDFSLWKDRLSKLQESELELICIKFYDSIFNTNSFNTFFSHCLIFSKWLKKPERLLLIQKLKARTRANKISYAKNKIPFEQDELDILNSIDLKNKLL